jgi:hypothetical protein
VDVGRIPILLAARPRTWASHNIAARTRVIQRRLDVIDTETRAYRAALRGLEREEEEKLKEVAKLRYDKRREREEAEAVIREKYTEERRLLDREYLTAVQLLKDQSKLEEEKGELAVRYDRESQVREEQLERFTARYRNVRVVHVSLFTDAGALGATMTAAIRQAGVAPPPAERKQEAEIAIQILSKMAQGHYRGYDVTPATGVILEALRTGRLSERGQIAAVDAAARLPGARSQAELVHAILDDARKPSIRSAAADGLVQNIQRFGVQLTEAQVEPLRELARRDKLDANLKASLAVVIGALRPGPRATGERLKRYDPRPVAPLPPPKK